MKHPSGAQRIRGQQVRRSLALAAITLLLLATVARSYAGDFINLTFNDGNVTPQDIASGGNSTGTIDRLLPGWRLFVNDTQPYTGLIQWGHPHEGMPFALFGSPWSNINPDASTLYALLIDTRLLPSTFSDPGYNIVHLRQTGTIPSSAQTLEFVPNLTLRINGVGVLTGPGGADVRAWAGQEVTLDFSNVDWASGGIIPTTAAFDIFGFYPIPEPSTWALLATGLGALILRWRRRSSGQAAYSSPPRSPQPIGLALGIRADGLSIARHLLLARRFTPFILVLALVAGCARDDARLQGTWRSNRDATAAGAFQRDPGWTNATPEKLQRFTNMFGHLTVTYSKGTLTSDNLGEVGSFPYRVLESGSNYVVIHSNAPLDHDREVRIRFVDGDNGYWIDTGPLGNGLEERFDRVKK